MVLIVVIRVTILRGQRTKLPGAVDVARLARVSPATVSRAFNAPELLDPVTLQRVRRAATKLNYLPFGVARSLRKRRSMVVGTVIQSMENASYIAGMVELSQALLAQRGYTMLLGSSAFSDARAVEVCRAMIRQGIDALILIAGQRDSAVFPLLREFGIPHVAAWVYDPDRPSIGFDHRRAMMNVAHHLVGLGHREFAVIIPFRKVNDVRRERLRGIQQVLTTHGVGRDHCYLVDDGGLGILDGRQAVSRILEHAPRTTAVICANDNIAAGVILECKARGLQIPDDISVTGYNDLEIASALDPSITTVRTPFSPIAHAAIDYLVTTLSGKLGPDPRCEETELIIRASTAKAPSRLHQRTR